ncbi:MAG: T9SS type A sorting domain-containing protein [Candidatus Cloacimonetes bacterium]|nr:T9SS type A sorting domain-containing protein [Candidatus Cloacimonadota bacterium]
MKTLTLLTLLALCALLYAQTELQTMLVFESPTDGTYDGHFGENISGNGDLNGDGFSDIVIPGHPLGEPEDERRLYIYLGGAQPDSVADYIIDVPPVDPGDMDSFGRFIAYDGDLNGDGYNDLVVAAPTYDGHFPDAGMVFIYWGGETLSTTPDVVLDGLDYGDDCWGLKFGSDLDTSGDLNGDGYDDLVIGSPGPSYYWNGQVDIFFGGDQFDTEVDWHLQGDYCELFGDNVATGDINGDGYDDLAVSQEIANSDYMQFQIYTGGETISTTASYVSDNIYSTNICQLFMNGDLNGDGLSDLIMINSTASGTMNVLLGDVYLDSVLLTYQLEGALRVVECFYSVFDNTCMIGGSSPLDSMIVFFEYVDEDSLITQYCRSFQSNGYSSAAYNVGDFNGDGHGDILQSSFEDSDNWQICILTTEYVDIGDEPSPHPSLAFACFPNPTRGGATVRFSLAQAGPVDAAVYNTRGQRVATLAAGHSFTAGEHTLRWDAGDAASGIYLVRMAHALGSTTSKLVLLK